LIESGLRSLAQVFDGIIRALDDLEGFSVLLDECFGPF
jgi:hypothetical protein